MTDETSAPAGGEAIAVITPAQDTGADLSISQAARALAAARHRPKEESAPVDQADPVEQPELAQANADPATAPSEEPEATEPAELPPIDPPRSWTQAEKERFQSLPRETQEYLHSREQEREREFRRGQNDIAEKSKAIEAKLSEAEKARQQYEAKLPALMQALHDTSPFADIKSMADVEKLQAEDPFRFQQFQVYQWKMQGVQAELQEAESRKATQHQTEWTNHVQTENAKAAEVIPELADEKKAPELHKRAAERLSELGFKPEELNDLASGKQKLSIYDHRIQQLIFSDLKLSDIQKAKTAVAAKPLPPVQRPGTSKPTGSAVSEHIQALTRQFNETGSLKIAQELRAAQARSQRRAS
ncbi:hypothetical protein GWE18_00325 [Bradyrhizobium sp. CSA112]|uniref:hypothetical protein n=1 Tax=Bradyrhizobium sp. CSA112 TaxID=2699170 RepID=UPI0023B07C00|nr:hypothetical protein [Bradyrhizobium sp. CSA112]MDE5451321.1 hypothetical protein [Bradyrhizobium sp. CSA112]